MKHILWYNGHELTIKNITKGKGCYVYDSKGKEYLDLESGIWCTSIGHCHPQINKIIKNQIKKINHTGYCYADNIIEKSAERILKTLNYNNGKCVFLCSGSEAIEFSIRIAKSISSKPLFLTMPDSYYGAYGSAYKKDKNEWYLFDWLKCRNCTDFENCNPDCKKLKEIPFNKISGFLFEPGSSGGLVRFPPEKIINNIVNKIKANNGIIIVNEVTTGIGRTGEWFGFVHYKINPDIVALGKGLGNGYPVSVAALNNNIIKMLNKKSYSYSQSHQNDPLGAAVANEVIKVIEQKNLIENSKEKGILLLNELKELQKQFNMIKEIRGRGLMLTVEFNDIKKEIASIIQKNLLSEGIIVAARPGLNVLRIDPPLIIEKKDINAFLKYFEKKLEEIK